MAIYNLGSINIDYFYKAPHLLQAGETLAASDFSQGLGGKGANQSVACARSGAQIFHIGHLHEKDKNWLSFLQSSGVDTSHIKLGDVPTGHAIIIIDEASGENQILLLAGANGVIDKSALQDSLAQATSSDWALCQNETNLGIEFLQMAHAKGLSICYSAAPFVKEVVLSVLEFVDLLVVNEIEAAEIEKALAAPPAQWGVAHLIITKGGAGAEYYGKDGQFHQPAHKVKAVDTTGAGDTYLGFLLGRLSMGDGMKQAMAIASKAAAIQVTRYGTAEAIPLMSELEI